MIVDKITVSDFRNIKAKVFSFSSSVTVIVGDNASGKTNVLEALYLLSTGKSFRARVEEEMIDYTKELTRVRGVFVNAKADKLKLEAILTRGRMKVGQNPNKFQRVARKKLLVNGVSKRLIDFSGNFLVVLFAPHDLDIVTESPSVRRKFLDSVLSQTDREYRRSLLSYEKGLRQRNKLLIRIREERLSRSQLLFWNSILIKNGDYLTRSRQKFTDHACVNEALNDQEFSVVYDKSAISGERLEKYSREEVAAGKTLVGPHRDDFVVQINNLNDKTQKKRDLARFGSRGEQRMGVLWLKLAELSFIHNRTGERPTLLLDDIFSELDHDHRNVVMKVVADQQTIITTADPHFVEDVVDVGKIEL